MAADNRVALITGANRGLGLETARQLGKMGITVLLGSRNQDQGEQGMNQLRAENIGARALNLDITNPEERDAAARYIEKEFEKLDILVNNAGTAREGWGRNTTLECADVLRELFETNLFAPIALTERLMPLLRKSPAARIVNVSSIMASLTLHSDPTSVIYDSKPFAYDASKTALNAFTIHLAHALRDTRIKVNSAHPGWVKTEIGGEHATMDVEEGAKTSVILATLPADGPSGGYFHLNQPLPW